jgi:hypothetical protein
LVFTASRTGFASSPDIAFTFRRVLFPDLGASSLLAEVDSGSARLSGCPVLTCCTATTHRVGADTSRGRDASQRRNSSTRADASSRENLHVWTSPHWELLAPVAKLNRHVGQRTSRSSGSFGQKYRPQGASPSPASKFQSHSSHGTNASAPSTGLRLPGRPRTASSCITHLASRSDATSEHTIGLEHKVPTVLGEEHTRPWIRLAIGDTPCNGATQASAAGERSRWS